MHIECHIAYTCTKALIKAFSVLKYKWYALRQYAMQTDLLTLYLLVPFDDICASSLDSDQARRNARPDLGPYCLTL